jgi:hypothetical protein
MTRFRRTKDELTRGLSPEQAQAEREAFKVTLASVAMPPMTADEAQKAYDEAEPVPLSKKEVEKIVRKVTRKGSGEIILRIKPGKGVDADYFEFLTGKQIEVEQDEHFYKWLDHLAGKVYDQHGQAKLFTDILSEGIGGVLTTRQFTKDIK